MARRKYSMTKEQRQMALNGLKLAYPHIWNGRGTEGRDTQTYICIAIGSHGYEGEECHWARHLVQRSLNGQPTYEGWLRHNGHSDAHYWAPRRVQAQRRRWVRHLIAELQKSLDLP